jgi:hypothetical protein
MLLPPAAPAEMLAQPVRVVLVVGQMPVVPVVPVEWVVPVAWFTPVG